MSEVKKVRRLDSISLKDKAQFTEEGYLIDRPILTTVGIFEYANPDGSVRRELRLPEHVFNEESLESYKGKPIIITHEAGVVDKRNVKREEIGTILSAGYQDGDNVRAEIVIHDTNAMERSGLKELSLGYNLELIEEPGVWNGQPYDAIQTNIIINHLALVASARAGEQARLNIDGSDEPMLKGGKAEMVKKRNHDGDVLTPEELEQSIANFKARKAERSAAQEPGEEETPETTPTAEDCGMDGADVEEQQTAEEETEAGKTPEEILQAVKDRRDRRDAEDDPEDQKAMGVIAQQDEDIDSLIAALECVLAQAKDSNADAGEEEQEAQKEEENADSSDDESKSLNADSADDIIRQRLSICRVGDKLHLDGLETKSIKEGKIAIIGKVFPNIRMDGKTDAYVSAMYDIAVAETNKRKDVEYQRKQMMAQQKADRADAKETTSALAARQRMIDREGGNM